MNNLGMLLYNRTRGIPGLTRFHITQWGNFNDFILRYNLCVLTLGSFYPLGSHGTPINKIA